MKVTIYFRDIFSLGFGPFRWVCTSGLAEDLQKTDEIAIKSFNKIIAGKSDDYFVYSFVREILWCVYSYIICFSAESPAVCHM